MKSLLVVAVLVALLIIAFSLSLPQTLSPKFAAQQEEQISGVADIGVEEGDVPVLIENPVIQDPFALPQALLDAFQTESNGQDTSFISLLLMFYWLMMRMLLFPEGRMDSL